MNWYLKVLKQYADFSGRAQRAEYWFFTLFSSLAYIVLAILDGLFGLFNLEAGIGLFSGLYSLAVLIPNLSVLFRRLHDTNRSGWWLLIAFIPLIGAIVLLVFLVQDSKEDNQYGLNPKGSSAKMMNDSVIEQLEKLAAMKDKGILSEEEFNTKKSELLGK